MAFQSSMRSGPVEPLQGSLQVLSSHVRRLSVLLEVPVKPEKSTTQSQLRPRSQSPSLHLEALAPKLRSESLSLVLCSLVAQSSGGFPQPLDELRAFPVRPEASHSACLTWGKGSVSAAKMQRCQSDPSTSSHGSRYKCLGESTHRQVRLCLGSSEPCESSGKLSPAFRPQMPWLPIQNGLMLPSVPPCP